MGPWLVLGALGVALLLLRAARKDRGDLAKLPLAKGHVPIAGCIPFAKAASSGKLHKAWEQIFDEAAGAPLVRVYVAGRLILVATTPEAFDAITRKLKFTPKMRAAYAGFPFLGYREPNMFTTDDAEEHARVRKELSVFFSTENILSVISKLTSLMRAACTDAVEAASRAPDGAAHVNIVALATNIIDAVVREVFFETDVLVPYATFLDGFAQIAEIQVDPLLMWRAKHGFGHANRRYRRNWRELRAAWETLLADIYERPMQAESRALWACLRRAYPEAMSSKAQHEGAISHLALVYGAGCETTVTAISMTMGALACEPETVRRLEVELDAAGLLATESNQQPRSPDGKDLLKLTYLDAIFHESLRYMPPAPTGTVRELPHDVALNGYRVPAGTNVSPPIWGFHRSRALWGEDAKEWRPERWLEGRSISAMKKDVASGCPRWIPFSSGRQNCIGQHLSTIDTKLAVASLLSRFCIAPDAAKMSCTSAKEFSENLSTHVTLRCDQGVWLKLSPRVASDTGSKR